MTTLEMGNSVAVFVQVVGSVLALKGVLFERIQNIYNQEVLAGMSFYGGPPEVDVGSIVRTSSRLKERAQVWLGAAMFLLGGLAQVALPFVAPSYVAVHRTWMLLGMMATLTALGAGWTLANLVGRRQLVRFVRQESQRMDWWNPDRFGENWNGDVLQGFADAIGHKFASGMSDPEKFNSLRARYGG